MIFELGEVHEYLVVLDMMSDFIILNVNIQNYTNTMNPLFVSISAYL